MLFKKTINIFFALFLFTVMQAQQTQTEQPVRGTWITNVGSKALFSKKNIRKAVKLCKQKGINNIFVVVWNNGVTLYPSEVTQQYINIKQDAVFKGFDPLATIVKESHRQGLKVHAWFEFGFSYAYKNNNSLWFQKYPHWAGKNNKGELLQKNGFFWWNALHPEVQAFMKKLVLEVVEKYAVDGIQGDDRMPAMPAEGGYDEYTKELYKKETGMNVPDDCREAKWLQWKADKISNFGKTLYSEVKEKKAGCLVSWSPSIYPWSKEQYLQNWPDWLNGGYADFIMPQLYRYDINAYEKILKELDMQVTPEQRKKIFPGILTSLANGYKVKREMLQQMIALNRKYGFNGECLFYFETLKTLGKHRYDE
jgi:uncharacterized lipoprotein YddW (UPF0748 family)